MTTHTGDATYDGSQYALQVIDGRVYWIATRSTSPLTSELRSVGVEGGPVGVRALGGAYWLSAWPWLGGAATRVGQPVGVLNLSTGVRRVVRAGPGEDVTCSPAWCKTIITRGLNTVITLARPDGRDRVRVNVDGETSAVVNVAALDRFELVAAPVPGPSASSANGFPSTT